MVMGGNSCAKGHEFEFWPHILDRHFFTYIFTNKEGIAVRRQGVCVCSVDGRAMKASVWVRERG